MQLADDLLATFIVTLALRLELTSAHGAVSQPPSRNALDVRLHPWNGSVPEQVPFMFWCASADARSSDPRKISGANGQACFWFSNGCDLSCE